MSNPEPDVMMLKRNLEALGIRSRRAIERVISSTSRTDAIIEIAPDGGASVIVGEGSARRQLSSRRAPREEASRLCDTIDVRSVATVVVSGFGSGAHVVELAKRIKKTGLVVCFEPDAALIRTVLERIDCSEAFAGANVVLITDDADRGAIADALTGFEGALAAGVTMLRHPPSAALLGDRAGIFERTFAEVMKAVRTAVLTTLVQVDTTVRNLLQNIGPYSTCAGIADLKDAAKGRAAIVVSAGPSLRRNIDLLKDPTNRAKCVVIAVQTVLKTLLKEGIRPDFVTALDYHEISKRFYEGLTVADVDGITLVAEPKANPAIIDAYPGEKRFVGDKVLDDVLGPSLAREMGELKPGATVAHLAYYLARHLGCDPVILIGQDLGFTDNQYYAPGAAIHRVWGGELNQFNTIEMLEWQRIARMRNMLRKVPAVGGGEIYTDEQMSTYLVQFERDFLDDSKRGLTIIDATEGGALKKHAVCQPLRETLESITTEDRFHAPVGSADHSSERRRQVEARVEALRADTERLKSISHETRIHLERMLDARDDSELNALIEKVQKNGARVAELSTAHRLVQYINQAGQLNRYKADRAITLDESLSAREKQKRQIERDLRNVSWLADVSAHTASMLRDCSASLNGAAKITRDADIAAHEDSSSNAAKKVIAVIIVDTAMSGLGTARDLNAPFASSTVLQSTIEAMRKVDSVDSIVIVCRDETSVRSMIAKTEDLCFVTPSVSMWDRRDARARSIAAARARSSHCWRGAIANLTSYDEAFFAPMAVDAMNHARAHAAVIIGPEWCLVDTDLVHKTVDRYRENPERNQITFSQAPAGKGVCVVSFDIARELSASDGPAATIGGLIAYHPLALQSDPIAKPQCVQIDASLRDGLGRFISDSVGRRMGSFSPTLWNIDPGASEGLLPVNMWRAFFASLAQSIEDVSVQVDARRSSERFVEQLVDLARSEGIPHLHLILDVNASPRLLHAAAEVITIDFGLDASAQTCEEWSKTLESVVPMSGTGMPRKWFVPTITRADSTLQHLEHWYDFWLLRRGVAVILPTQDNHEARIQPMPIPDFVRNYQEDNTVHVSPTGAVMYRGSEIGVLSKDHALEILDRIGVLSCELATAGIADE